MDIVIKDFSELSAAKLHDILRVRCDVFVVEQDCAYPDIDGNDPKATHLYVEQDGRVAACCRVLPKGVTFPTFAIGRLVTHPDFRGRGLARKLMKRAMAYILDEKGEQEVMISAQKYLARFYAGLGFSVVSDEYIEDGISHLDMACDLTDRVFDRDMPIE